MRGRAGGAPGRGPFLRPAGSGAAEQGSGSAHVVFAAERAEVMRQLRGGQQAARLEAEVARIHDHSR
jgi:hypothetical protein